MKALITGATGFVGRRLLEQISQPVIVSRDAAKAQRQFPRASVCNWDPQREPAPAAAFEGVEAVFHLAGEPVAEGRWTAAKKQRIRDSRVVGTRNLVAGLAKLERRPPVLVSASAVGYYGSRGEELLDETSAPANDFLGDVCRAWEDEARRAESLGVRVVHLRIGIILGPKGGALGKMLPIFKLGLGGPLGNGRAWMPWIHLDDIVGLLLHAAAHDEIRGPMNAVGPQPVTNREFTKTLASVVRRPAIFPAPGLGLRLALGEFAQVLLASQRVVPRVAQASGYQFQYPQLRSALVDATR